MASGIGEPVSWCSAMPGDGDDDADQRGGVLGEHRPQGGVGGVQDVAEQPPVELARASAGPGGSAWVNEMPSSTKAMPSTT